MNKQRNGVKKLNITIEESVYVQIQTQAKKDYIGVATYVKQLIMRSLDGKNNCIDNCLTNNGSTM